MCHDGPEPRDTGRANTPITIAVDARQGCLGCFTTFDPCSVTVAGDRITLSMVTRTCQPAGDVGCPAICALQATTCTIPPLPAGTYKLDVLGDQPHPGLPERELVIDARADEGETRCTLPSPPKEPAPIADVYPRNCTTDKDCVLVTVGDACSPCKCPSSAIAKSILPVWEGVYRATTSQCPPSDALLKCAACQERKATCVNTAPGTPSGECTISPM